MTCVGDTRVMNISIEKGAMSPKMPKLADTYKLEMKKIMCNADENDAAVTPNKNTNIVTIMQSTGKYTGFSVGQSDTVKKN